MTVSENPEITSTDFLLISNLLAGNFKESRMAAAIKLLQEYLKTVKCQVTLIVILFMLGRKI